MAIHALPVTVVLAARAEVAWNPQAWAFKGHSAARELPVTIPRLAGHGVAWAAVRTAHVRATRDGLSHPRLFWSVNEAATAQAVVQQLLRQTPGWGTTLYNGSQGYGIYLTYRPVV
jgi:hypothetical protein